MRAFRAAQTPKLSALCVLAAFLGATNSVARPVTDRAPRSLNTPSAIERFVLIETLANLGRETRDALMLITAAHVRAGITSNPERVQSLITAPKSARPLLTPPLTQDPLSQSMLLEDARSFAAEDPVVIAMIEEAYAATSKGRLGLGGLATTHGVVKAGATELLLMNFHSGDRAEIYLTNHDLELTVQDQKNRNLCTEAKSDSRGVCTWKPRTSGPFYIRIKNPTAKPVAFVLMSN